MTKVDGWIGVDLDGTLAIYDCWRGPDHIGEPIPAMVDRVKRWLAAGNEVRIFTARVSDGLPSTRETIRRWSRDVFGVFLEVTCIKDYGMAELWDDRAVQVVENTGQVIHVGPSRRGLS
jgi:hypothetical protein